MKIHLFLFLILLAGVTQAQNLPGSLSLEEAIAFGLTHNRSIINADREIQKAKKEKWKTIATGLPQIQLRGQLSKLFGNASFTGSCRIFWRKPGRM